MSKRRSTPSLPSMDEILGGEGAAAEKSSQAPKGSGAKSAQDNKENRIKVTYYFPEDLVDQIDAAHLKINKIARGSGLKFHKYDIARVAWKLMLESLEQDGEESELVQLLLKGE
ncbi:MAG: hypothetical protein AAF629_21020 [Chloroflexota bacterium]